MGVLIEARDEDPARGFTGYRGEVVAFLSTRAGEPFTVAQIAEALKGPANTARDRSSTRFAGEECARSMRRRDCRYGIRCEAAPHGARAFRFVEDIAAHVAVPEEAPPRLAPSRVVSLPTIGGLALSYDPARALMIGADGQPFSVA